MRSDRRGLALLSALLTIACVAAMLGGLAFVARHDHALGIAARQSQLAFAAAELAAWSAVAALDSAAMSATVGDEVAIGLSPPPAAAAGSAVVRLSDNVFVAIGEATPAPGAAGLRRRVAILLSAHRDSGGAVTYQPLPERSWVALP